MNIRESILQQMPGISQPQKKFLITLFSTILLVYGKLNFTNLSPYSYLSEKTYRRHFLKNFNFPQFNQYFLKEALNSEHTVIAVIDCYFLRKSGKKTDGKAYFYNGVAGKSSQGLEISVISIVEIETRLSDSLSVQQTPSRPQIKPGKKLPQNQKNSRSKKSRKKPDSQSSKPDITRVDDYAQHLKNTRCFCPTSVRYLVADGYYYRSQFWDAVRELNLRFIGKLRVDANLRYLYTGEQKKLGAPRKYDGKVDCQDLSRLNFVKYLKPGGSLYTLVVGSCCLNCQITLACISEVQAKGKIKNALLFSTDIHLLPEQIVEYDRARFPIEFIFRDPKQFTGLSDCQARHLPRLDFHFNASLIALNLAKHELSSCHSSAKSFVFSICSYKRLEFNKHLLSTLIDQLDLDPDLILNHPNLPSVLSYGTLAA
jgi:hypothetical protein